MDGTTPGTPFRLVRIALLSEEFGEMDVPLEAPADGTVPDPFDLPHGAVVTLALVFRTAVDIDGLAYTETRVRDGAVLSTVRTALGGYRAGGPYEIRMPPERLPNGRSVGNTYEVTGTFSDASGHELATERHRFRLCEPGRGPARPVQGAAPAAP
ncbi:hypothetical protein ABZ924_23380 [Streptomyces sp. NPDC046876]|uniref:hypothetical protein n=1 Tax=Streptomyces sp. NPDC046876 TaxID=3155616 RepID=UPI0033CF4920